MKKLLFLLLMLPATFSYGQDKGWNWGTVSPIGWLSDHLSYNKKHHSIKKHARKISINYGLELGLNKAQRKKLRAQVEDHLVWSKHNIWAPLFRDTDINTPYLKDQLRQGHLTQAFLQARFQEMLNEKQYMRYQKVRLPAEILYAQGGPF